MINKQLQKWLSKYPDELQIITLDENCCAILAEPAIDKIKPSLINSQIPTYSIRCDEIKEKEVEVILI